MLINSLSSILVGACLWLLRCLLCDAGLSSSCFMPSPCSCSDDSCLLLVYIYTYVCNPLCVNVYMCAHVRTVCVYMYLCVYVCVCMLKCTFIV